MATTKTIKKSAEKIIEDITYSSSHQSISRRVIYEYKNLKIKLELQSDGYKRQCYARASAFCPLPITVPFGRFISASG